MQVRDLQFLRAHTSRRTKITVPGPFTMSQQAQDDFYGSPRELGLAYADAVRAEIRDLFAAGADVVQLDEPYMQARPEAAREYGLEVVRRATDGIAETMALHICFGYAAIIHVRPSGYSFLPELATTELDQISIETAQSGLALDVLDALARRRSSSASSTSRRLRSRRPRRSRPDPPRVPARGPERLIAAPDCGMKYLPRDAAYGKLEALVAGARLASAEAPVTTG